MSTKRKLLTVLAASAVLLALVFGSQLAGGSAQARPPVEPPVPPGTRPEPGRGVTIPYPGRLTNTAGQPVPNGTYDFTFTLYAAETGGSPLWSETQTGVLVQSGAFQASLGTAQLLTPAALDGNDRWLEVTVRGPGEADFTALTPRQRLTADAPAAPGGATAGLACPHDHLGEVWSGSVNYLPGQDRAALKVTNSGNGIAVWGEKTIASSDSVAAVYGTATTNFGVWGYSDSGRGVYGSSLNGIGVYGWGGNEHGVYGQTDGDWNYRSGVYGLATNANANGVTGWNNVAGAGVYGYSNTGIGVVAKSKTGNPILAYQGDASTGVRVMRVDATGRGFFNGGHQDGGADVAEFIQVSDEPQPGDVVEIDPDHPGQFRLATTPNSAAVAGVLSTNPGVSLNAVDPATQENTGPQLALAGTVPVKVSAENGAIRPGDLLVVSATPGHAMRAPANPAPGTVIGKALGSLESGTGVIEMLVMLR